MTKKLVESLIGIHPDFPKKGILFRDITPVFQKPTAFDYLINELSKSSFLDEADAIVSIDARGFIMGSALSIKLSKPLLFARKPGKLPGELITKSYELEYGTNSLSIQKKILENYSNYVIVDDLLATGGTAKCVSEIIESQGKNVLGLIVAIELLNLKGKQNFGLPVESLFKY